MSLFQYQLLPQTTYGIFHSTEETAGQFKIPGMWFKQGLHYNIPLIPGSWGTHDWLLAPEF